MTHVKHGIAGWQHSHGQPGLYEILAASGSTLLDGLVSWWDLDETSGTRYDSVGSNDLTDVNTVEYAAGKIGNAASFVAANNEYLSLPDSDTFSPTGSFTANIWVLPTTTSIVFFFAKEETDPLSEWSILTGAGGAPEGRIWHTGGLVQCLAGPWVQWKWTMVTLVYDIDTGFATLYNDASAGTPLAVSGTLHNRSGKLTIGGGARATYQDNTCDMAGFWNRALTADEIIELYNLGASIKNPFEDNGEGFREGLVAYYKLDETSGTRADSVGSNDLADVNTVGSATGVSGNAAVFVSANSEHLQTTDAGNAFSIPSTGGTITMWFRSSVLSGIKGVSGKGDVASLDEWQIYTNGANLTFQVKLSGGGYSSPVKAISTDTWYFCALWYDPNNDKCYVQVNDSAPGQATAASVPTADQGGDLALGAIGSGSTYMDGNIDEFAFYDRVLSADERTALYASGAGRFYDFQV